MIQFLRDTDREELKIGKNDVTLQWLCYNGFFQSPMFIKKLQYFLLTGYAGKY